jgi:hypothetical protein
LGDQRDRAGALEFAGGVLGHAQEVRAMPLAHGIGVGEPAECELTDRLEQREPAVSRDDQILARERVEHLQRRQRHGFSRLDRAAPSEHQRSG